MIDVEGLRAAIANAMEALGEAAEQLPEPTQQPPVAKADDGKMTTSLRIEPEKLEALKIIALRKRVPVNDLVLEGIDHVIGLRRGKAA